MPAVIVGTLAFLCGTTFEDNKTCRAGSRGIDVALVAGQLPERSTGPAGLDVIKRYVAKVAVVGYQVPLGVVLVALTDDSHLGIRLRVALGYYGAGIGTGEVQMVIIDAVGAHRSSTGGGVHLAEVTLFVELQNILLNALVGRIGSEIDIVAVGQGHTLIFTGTTSPHRSELTCLAVVGDDVGALVDIVTIDVAIEKGVDH